jgi:hypothetical protein
MRSRKASPFKFGAYSYGSQSVKVDNNTDFYVIPVGRKASVCGYKTTGTTAVFYVNQLERPIPRIEKMKYATLFFYMQENLFYPTTLRGIPVIIGKGCIFERYTGEPIVITAAQNSDDTSEVLVNHYKAGLIKSNFGEVLSRAIMNAPRAGLVSIKVTPVTVPFTERVEHVKEHMRERTYNIQHTYQVVPHAPDVFLQVENIGKLNIIND